MAHPSVTLTRRPDASTSSTAIGDTPAVDIAGFLRRYPPFDALSAERLAEVARSVEIEHFPGGAVILQQGGEPATALYVVRKGAVELLDDGQVLDLLLEGEVFGQFSLLAHEVPSLTVRAQEDTLCYLVPEPTADPVLETHAGLSFVIGSMRRRIAVGDRCGRRRARRPAATGG